MIWEETNASLVEAKTNMVYIARKDATFNLPSERGFGDDIAFICDVKTKARIKAPKGTSIVLDKLKTRKGGYIESASGTSFVKLANYQSPEDEHEGKVWNVVAMYGNWNFLTGRKPELKPESQCKYIC